MRSFTLWATLLLISSACSDKPKSETSDKSPPGPASPATETPAATAAEQPNSQQVSLTWTAKLPGKVGKRARVPSAQTWRAGDDQGCVQGNLVPGSGSERACVVSTGLAITGGDAPAAGIEVATFAIAGLVAGNVLDVERKREELDELVLAGTERMGVVAYDWLGKRPVLIIDQAAPGEGAPCSGVSHAPFARAWDVLGLPSATGGAILVIGEPSRFLWWRDDAWCLSATAEILSPEEAKETDRDTLQASADVDGDGKPDAFTVKPLGVTWQLSTSHTGQISLGEDTPHDDQTLAFAVLNNWLAANKRAVLVNWDLTYESGAGLSGFTDEKILATDEQGRLRELFAVSGGATIDAGESEEGLVGDVKETRRQLSPQRFPHMSLLLKSTLSVTESPKRKSGRVSRIWFPVGSWRFDVDRNDRNQYFVGGALQSLLDKWSE